MKSNIASPIALLALFLLVSILQVALIFMRLYETITWHWYIVLLPLNYYVLLAGLFMSQKYNYMRMCKRMDKDPRIDAAINEVVSDRSEHYYEFIEDEEIQPEGCNLIQS